MLDLRPIGYVIGLLVAMLGIAMMVPLFLDLADGNPHWAVFAESGIITLVIGGVIALSCSNSVGAGLTIQQTF